MAGILHCQLLTYKVCSEYKEVFFWKEHSLNIKDHCVNKNLRGNDKFEFRNSCTDK